MRAGNPVSIPRDEPPESHQGPGPAPPPAPPQAPGPVGAVTTAGCPSPPSPSSVQGDNGPLYPSDPCSEDQPKARECVATCLFRGEFRKTIVPSVTEESQGPSQLGCQYVSQRLSRHSIPPKAAHSRRRVSCLAEGEGRESHTGEEPGFPPKSGRPGPTSPPHPTPPLPGRGQAGTRPLGAGLDTLRGTKGQGDQVSGSQGGSEMQPQPSTHPPTLRLSGLSPRGPREVLTVRVAGPVSC